MVNKASFIIYRSPSSAIDLKILEEVWTGRPVDYLSLKIFGCPTFVHVQSGEHSKLDSKSRKCIFLGFEKGVKSISNRLSKAKYGEQTHKKTPPTTSPSPNFFF